MNRIVSLFALSVVLVLCGGVHDVYASESAQVRGKRKHPATKQIILFVKLPTGEYLQTAKTSFTGGWIKARCVEAQKLMYGATSSRFISIADQKLMIGNRELQDNVTLESVITRQEHDNYVINVKRKRR